MICHKKFAVITNKMASVAVTSIIAMESTMVIAMDILRWRRSSHISIPVTKN